MATQRLKRCGLLTIRTPRWSSLRQRVLGQLLVPRPNARSLASQLSIWRFVGTSQLSTTVKIAKSINTHTIHCWNTEKEMKDKADGGYEYKIVRAIKIDLTRKACLKALLH